MPRLFLTDQFVANAICSSDKCQETFWDAPNTLDGKIRKGSIEGLGLRVTSGGSKSFVHDFHFLSKRKRIVIGNAKVISVGSARIKVRGRLVQLESGENPDPSVNVANDNQPLTVASVVEQYWQIHFPDKSKQHRADFKRYIAPWVDDGRRVYYRRASDKRFGELFGDRLLADIKPLDVRACLDQYDSPSAYNSTYSHIKALFNWAIRMQLVDMRNPCDPFKKKKTLRQKRHYEPQDIQTITRYIFDPPQKIMPALRGSSLERRDNALELGRITTQNEAMVELCHFMGILFLTMARPIELKNAEFGHFDLERLIWHKHNTKGIKLSKSAYEYAYRSVPIHPKVAKIVAAQRKQWPGSRLVFPSHDNPALPRDNFRKAFGRFRELDGVPEYFQMYDLKRIAISLMLTRRGVRPEMLSHYVDHKGNLETTLIYDLGFVDPLRPVSDELGKVLGV